MVTEVWNIGQGHKVPRGTVVISVIYTRFPKFPNANLTFRIL